METKSIVMGNSLRISSKVTSCLLLLLVLTPQLAAQATQPDSERQIGVSTEETGPLPQRGRVRDLPRDLAKSSLQLFSRDNLLPWIVGAGATAASYQKDAEVRTYFASPRLGRVGDRLGSNMGGEPFVAAAVGSLFVVSRFRGSEEFGQFGYDLTQATLLNALLTAGLKNAVQRTRPSGGNYSFPSGHTSTAFAAAAVLDHYYGWKTSVAAYATAAFIGVSRIDMSKHYLSDVVAGATVGYIAGRTVTRSSKTKHAFLWAPIVSPASETVGIVVVWEPHCDAQSP
jgi:PAP2 superfamily